MEKGEKLFSGAGRYHRHFMQLFHNGWWLWQGLRMLKRLKIEITCTSTSVTWFPWCTSQSGLLFLSRFKPSRTKPKELEDERRNCAQSETAKRANKEFQQSFNKAEEKNVLIRTTVILFLRCWGFGDRQPATKLNWKWSHNRSTTSTTC